MNQTVPSYELFTRPPGGLGKERDPRVLAFADSLRVGEPRRVEGLPFKKQRIRIEQPARTAPQAGI